MSEDEAEPAKRCRDCGETKPFSEFWRLASSPDGRAYYCRPCFSSRNRATAARRAASAGRQVRRRRVIPVEVGPGQKWCWRCESLLPIEDFVRNKSAKDGVGSYCRPCQRAQAAESRIRRHGSSRHYHLRQRYGIGAAEVEAMLDAQGWRCPICLVQLTDKTAHVDHDHGNGNVRGVLCFNCNGGLGQFRDDPGALQRAVVYLTATGAATIRPQSVVDMRLARLVLSEDYGHAC